MKRSTIKNLFMFGCDLLVIDPPQLIFWKEERIGKYFPDGRLYLNDSAENLMVVFTLFHELRHAYQIQAVEESWEAPERCRIWDYELRNYIPGGSVGHGYQHVEIDAHAFASMVIIRLWGIRPVIDEVDEEDLTARVAELLEEYSAEEVMEVKSHYKIPEEI